MNANTILNSDMTLEEQLEAIQRAVEDAQNQANEAAAANGTVAAPVDPSTLFACDSCQ